MTDQTPQQEQPLPSISLQDFFDVTNRRGFLNTATTIVTAGLLAAGLGQIFRKATPEKFVLVRVFSGAENLQEDFKKIYADLYDSMAKEAAQAKAAGNIPHFTFADPHGNTEALMIQVAGIQIAKRLLDDPDLVIEFSERELKTATSTSLKKEFDDYLLKGKGNSALLGLAAQGDLVMGKDKMVAYGLPIIGCAHTLGMKLFPGDPLHPSIKEHRAKGLAAVQDPLREKALVAAAGSIKKPSAGVYGAAHIKPMIEIGLTPAHGYFYYDTQQADKETLKRLDALSQERVNFVLQSPFVTKISFPGNRADIMPLIGLTALLIATDAEHKREKGEITQEQLSSVYSEIHMCLNRYFEITDKMAGLPAR